MKLPLASKFYGVLSLFHSLFRLKTKCVLMFIAEKGYDDLVPAYIRPFDEWLRQHVFISTLKSQPFRNTPFGILKISQFGGYYMQPTRRHLNPSKHGVCSKNLEKMHLIFYINFSLKFFSQ